MARLGYGTLGTQGRVGNDIVRLTRTELPYPIKVTHCPILSYLVYRQGSVVPCREWKKEVMDRVGSLDRVWNHLTIHWLHFLISLLSISFLPNPFNFATFLPYITKHPHLNPHYHTTPRHTTPHPTLSYPTAGFVIDKTETIHQIRPKRPRAETTQAETTQGQNDSRLKRSRAETARYRLWKKSFKLQIAAYNYGYPKFDF